MYIGDVMRLAELLIRKRFLESKIDLLNAFIVRLVSNDETSQEELVKLRKELDECLDLRQKYIMKIIGANSQIDLEVGKSDVSLRDAVMIRETIKKKIENVSLIIKNSNGNIDALSFLRQREQLIEEYVILDSAIQMMEWSASLD